VADHPVKVPEELVRKWATWRNATDKESFWLRIATEVAQWGADQELEACIKWFDAHIPGYEMVADRLRAARRAMPPTLAEQGMEALNKGCFPSNDEIATIRAALNRLAELEDQQ